MTKKQKKNIETITKEFSKQCQVTTEPCSAPPGDTILDDEINPELLAKWPKLKLKVPPIFIHKPVDFEPHVKKILQMGIKFYQPHLGKAYTRVICETFQDHKYLAQYLEKKKLPYHTFGNPSKRKMKVVIRGMPNNMDLNLIKNELKSLSIPVVRVHKMRTGQDRKDNTMLILAVVPYDSDGKVILKIKQLLGHQVELEPPKERLRQCYRCQKWGHSQRYCHGEIKCVKCAGEHLTKKCKKPVEIEPKCANCGNTHVASYRKCVSAHGPGFYQMMQDLKTFTPCYRPNILVTMDNYHTLYKNVNYDNKTAKVA